VGEGDMIKEHTHGASTTIVRMAGGGKRMVTATHSRRGRRSGVRAVRAGD
jgi:hypothetical protein